MVSLIHDTLSLSSHQKKQKGPDICHNRYPGLIAPARRTGILKSFVPAGF